MIGKLHIKSTLLIAHQIASNAIELAVIVDVVFVVVIVVIIVVVVVNAAIIYPSNDFTQRRPIHQ